MQKDSFTILGLSQLLNTKSKDIRAFTNLIPHVCFLTTTEGKTLWHNDLWYDFSGLTPEEVGRENWPEIIHPEDFAEATVRWDEAVRKKKRFEACYRMKSKTGEYHWFLGRGTPIFDDHENVTGWFTTATNIEKYSKTIKDDVVSTFSRHKEHLALIDSPALFPDRIQ